MVYVVVESLKIQGLTRLQESLLRFCFSDYRGKNVSFPVSLYFERKKGCCETTTNNYSFASHRLLLLHAAKYFQQRHIGTFGARWSNSEFFKKRETAIICSTLLHVASKRGSKSKSYRTELKLQKGLTSTKKIFFSSIHHLNYFLLLSFHFFSSSTECPGWNLHSC